MDAKSQPYLKSLKGVIAGGARRTQKALISFAYPLFVKPESVSPSLTFYKTGKLGKPPFEINKVIPNVIFLTGGTLEDYDPFITLDNDLEEVMPEMSFRSGGTLEDYDPFEYYTEPATDRVSPIFSFRLGGNIYDAAVRYNEDPLDLVSPTFNFRTGGSLTG